LKLPAIFLILTGILLSGGCGAPPQERHTLESTFMADNHPVQESWNIDLVLTDGDMRKGNIRSSHGTEYQTEGKSIYYLDGGIAVEFFNNSGKSSTIITADKAVIHENQDIEASGNVVARSGNTVLKTSFLKRTADDRKIRSNSHVTIANPKGTIRGTGFESDQSLKKYRIFKASGETPGQINR
jgi:LPS export ABC transporter protein LptC